MLKIDKKRLKMDDLIFKGFVILRYKTQISEGEGKVSMSPST